jgi:mono/diheme cytochrome c family protein
MSDLSAAAASLGIPESLVQRSAEARAQETGATVDEILAAWAGGGSAPAPAATSSASEPEPEASEEDTDGAAAEEPAKTAPDVKIEIPEPAGTATRPAAAGPVTRAPTPAEVTSAEAANLPVVVTVPTVGIKERTNFAIPTWLAGLFILVPLFALFALGGAATGECGSDTELATNVITGQIVNCDGSAFEGSSVGGGSTDYLALGEAIYAGQEVGAVNCAGCHGAGGGGGVGPALNGVLNTFGSCADHEEWVALGSSGFQAAGRQTYGDTNKPVTSGMPGFSSTLSEEQLAAVTAFERVRFGGQDPEAALSDCGLAEEPAEGEGEAPAEGEPPADGEGETPPAGEETGDSVPPETTVPEADA